MCPDLIEKFESDQKRSKIEKIYTKSIKKLIDFDFFDQFQPFSIDFNHFQYFNRHFNPILINNWLNLFNNWLNLFNNWLNLFNNLNLIENRSNLIGKRLK